MRCRCFPSLPVPLLVARLPSSRWKGPAGAKKGSCAATTTLRRSVAFVPLERSARRKGALLPFRDVFLFAVSFSGGTVCEPPRAERTVAASGVRKCFHCSPSPPPLLLRPSGEPSRAEKGCCDGVAVRLRALSVVGSVPCRSRPRRAVGAVCSNLDPSPCRARKRGRCGGRGSEAFPLLPFAASPSSPSRRTSPGGKGVLRRGSCAVGLRLFSVAAPCLLPELLYGLKGDCFAAFAGWVQEVFAAVAGGSYRGGKWLLQALGVLLRLPSLTF